jgi:hypothetical protein
MRKIYDLLVVGGGITGCEAAWHAAGLGASVLLVSMSLDQINLPPYISALFPERGKTEEMLDMLGETLFGRALERSIMGHYEHPDAGKDILVFDKREFSLVSKESLEKKRGLDARQALIREMRSEEETVVESIFGEEFSARKAIISPGSYVNGRIRTGKLTIESGRYGDLAADELGESLRRTGVEMERWCGTIPQVLDSKKVDTSAWTEAKAAKGLLRGNFAQSSLVRREKPPGEERKVYWRGKEGEIQLLLPVGRKTSEAYLLREKTTTHGPEAFTIRETIRGQLEQECLVMSARGPLLPESVRLAGSFGGAKGYLECVRDGREKVVETLEESA